MEYILVINPGSTSTKIALFQNKTQAFVKNLKHSLEDLQQFSEVLDQFVFRKEMIIKTLEENGYKLSQIKLIMSRGGLCKPIESGVYKINETMLTDLRNASMQHASNLGAMIAYDLGNQLDVDSMIADPVVVDELQDVARFSGHPDYPRVSVFHALNTKAVSRTYAQSIGKLYEDLNLIVVHLGGGISVGAHQKGKVIDVNQALDGEGPFSPERSGTLPMGDVIRACFKGEETQGQMLKKMVGKGGLAAYLGTNDAYAVELEKEKGDAKAKEVLEAMVYQISKEIGSYAAVLKGEIDAIILTGGMAHSSWITQEISSFVEFIAPIKIYPGEDEMAALAQNAVGYLENKIELKQY